MINFLYSLISVELFTGGGGHFFLSGSITPRMFLFVTALVTNLLFYLRAADTRKLKSLSILLVIGFFVAHLPSLLIGLGKGASLRNIFTDLSPMLYWLMAPFFATVLESELMVRRTAALLQWSAIGVAMLYLVVLAAITIDAGLSFGFHSWADKTGEISFRNDQLFFYKGFLYLGIGIVFVVARGGRWQGFWLSILVVALTLTLTRGFVVATSFATILLLVMMKRWRTLYAVLGVIVLVIYAVEIYLPSLDTGSMLLQRGISNSIRIDDFVFMKTHFDVSYLIFGEGMGTFINGRLNIENSYLMILWKMGLWALFFWMIPLGIALNYFRKIKRNSEVYKLGCAFFCGLILIYIQTNFNPYLSNSIGLSFVLMAVFSLRTLAVSDAGRLLPTKVVED